MNDFYEWKDGLLFSKQYDDYYHSKQGNLEEKLYVFINSNNLIERWRTKDRFTIFEFGFGIGLNFVLTWKLWKECNLLGKTLEYISIEKNILPFSILKQYLEQHKEYQSLLDELEPYYNFPTDGVYKISLSNNFILTLYVQDFVQKEIDLQNTTVDAWYLDGFSPSKNPEMWSETAFQLMKKHSYKGSSYSTYSASSIVKESLLKCGFSVNKKEGFGNKRDMLVGDYTLEREPAKNEKPWYTLPSHFSKVGRAIILGGGVAGASVAYKMSKKGWDITLIEKEEQIALGASGNKAGVVAPKLTAQKTIMGELSIIGFSYFIKEVSELSKRDHSIIWKNIGVLELIQNEEEQLKLEQGVKCYNLKPNFASFVDKEKASQLAGIKLKYPGLFFSMGGYCNPPSYCKALLNAIPNLKLIVSTEGTQLDLSTGTKKVLDSNGNTIASGDVIILTNSFWITQFPETSWLPFRVMRGQVLHIPENILDLSLQTVVYYDGYIIPLNNQSFLVGSTFHPKDRDLNVKPEINRLLYNKFIGVAEEIPDIPVESMDGKVGFRAMSVDHTPIIGAVPDKSAFDIDYSTLWKGKFNAPYPLAKHLSGVYAMCGLGSKGITYSTIGAEILASMISGDSIPIEKAHLDKLNPARFIVHDLIGKKKYRSSL